MRHSRIVFNLLVKYATVLLAASLSQTCFAGTFQSQDPQPTTSASSTQGATTPPPTSASSTQGATTTSASSTQGATTPPPAPAKATKKVWTNEDVGGLTGSVSVVGNSKNLGKPGPGKPADPQYIANTRKELQKLRSELDDTTKELADLQDFQAGKTPASSGYPINKGYSRTPVDQQIASLAAKKKDLEGKIDALLDEARKKGVQPGDLR